MTMNSALYMYVIRESKLIFSRFHSMYDCIRNHDELCRFQGFFEYSYIQAINGTNVTPVIDIC